MAQPNAAEYRGRGTACLRAVYRASRVPDQRFPLSAHVMGKPRQLFPSGGPGILHRIERVPEQTGLVGIHVQPGVLQGEEELVRCLDC